MSPAWSNQDHARMDQAINLARLYNPHPNPRVGCVIVDREGQVVGEGAHRGPGTSHAEAIALQQAGDSARGATLYVTLEPCSHLGRTPPCARSVTEAGVGRVEVAAYDPDIRVRGRGIEILEQAGIETRVGLRSRESIRLDTGFHYHRRTGLPYIKGVIADPQALADPSVRADLDTLVKEADYVLDTRPDGLEIPLSQWAALQAEKGHLDLAIRDADSVPYFREESLIKEVSLYLKAHCRLPADWEENGFRLIAEEAVGPGFRRFDLARPIKTWGQLVRRRSETVLPTRYGRFRAIGYQSLDDGRQHLALVQGEVTGEAGALVRIHSECLTGDVFSSLRCDCGFQLDEAMRRIGEAGRGVVVYIRGHEGRGVGLIHKLSAYALQDQGRDTVEANLELGLPADRRDYGVGARILTDLGVTHLRLLSNNPAKSDGLKGNGLKILERVTLLAGENDHNRTYLRTKVAKLGHVMDLEGD
ncbi:MAG: GTP cyclohydrolase II [bacterium]|nr:GTP cyclohydrolase II [bacterium]